MIPSILTTLILFFLTTTTSLACSTPHLPHHPLCPGPPQPWESRISPGKGLGVFATQPLSPGDLILSEPPIILIKPDEFRDGAAYPLTSIQPLLETAFQNLSSEQQASVLSLHAHITPQDVVVSESGRLLPIFRSNAYIVGKTMTELGLFPQGARINHSCRPNSSQVWHEKSGKRVVRATRRIEVGDEIFATYIPLLRSRDMRRKRLEQYGFECTCEVCAADAPISEASDMRRDQIRYVIAELEPQLSLSLPQSKAGMKRSGSNAEESLRLVELVEEEGLADYYAQVYRIVALSHVRVENWELATTWAARSYELFFKADPDSMAAEEMSILTRRFIGSWNQELFERSKRDG